MSFAECFRRRARAGFREEVADQGTGLDLSVRAAYTSRATHEFRSEHENAEEQNESAGEQSGHSAASLHRLFILEPAPVHRLVVGMLCRSA